MIGTFELLWKVDQSQDLMRIFKIIAISIAVLCIGSLAFLTLYVPPLPENHGKLDMQLFMGDTSDQPLLVGFGGGEGGNAWASDHWKPIRDRFLEKGYAFLAIGYFGGEHTAETLDRIPLEVIRDSIMRVAARPNIQTDKIALIGGSKGAELILNLGSRYTEFSSLIAIVPSHVSFPALTPYANTSSWMYLEEDVPFVPASFETIPAALKGDLYEAFSLMLKDTRANKHASIEVENIEGSILFLSATQDEMWPSTYMANQMMARLDSFRFEYPYSHIALEGGHTEPLEHFDVVFEFLAEHFR